MNLLPLPSLRHAFFPFSSSPLKFSIPTPLPSSLPLPQPSGRAGRLSVKSIGIDDAGDNSRNGEDDSEDEDGSPRPPDSRIDDGTDIEQITSARESFRKNLERMIGKDDMSFTGMDLATLIRNKYGRSYDVQLIKKEFMGKNLLAMNVMWKYMEQRSFPLTEEEYILRLDDVANTLKCWGAVSHVRNTLDKSKERPRIGKAVSIFIDMDDSGGRANEWIYR